MNRVTTSRFLDDNCRRYTYVENVLDKFGSIVVYYVVGTRRVHGVSGNLEQPQENVSDYVTACHFFFFVPRVGPRNIKERGGRALNIMSLPPKYRRPSLLSPVG